VRQQLPEELFRNDWLQAQQNLGFPADPCDTEVQRKWHSKYRGLSPEQKEYYEAMSQLTKGLTKANRDLIKERRALRDSSCQPPSELRVVEAPVAPNALVLHDAIDGFAVVPIDQELAPFVQELGIPSIDDFRQQEDLPGIASASARTKLKYPVDPAVIGSFVRSFQLNSKGPGQNENQNPNCQEKKKPNCKNPNSVAWRTEGEKHWASTTSCIASGQPFPKTVKRPIACGALCGCETSASDTDFQKSLLSELAALAKQASDNGKANTVFSKSGRGVIAKNITNNTNA